MCKVGMEEDPLSVKRDISAEPLQIASLYFSSYKWQKHLSIAQHAQSESTVNYGQQEKVDIMDGREIEQITEL